MASSGQPTSSVHRDAAKFALTRWSVVLAAGRSDSTHARDALEKLCQIYWPPIYAFVRCQGHTSQDAQDFTQEFFSRLLQNNSRGSVNPAKSRFRSFLLASVKHFLANEWHKAKARKRGGDRIFIPMDASSAEDLLGLQPVENLNPEKIFERRWAVALLEQVLAQLRDEYARAGKLRLFEQLKTTLTETSRSVSYAEIAGRLKMSEGSVKVAVHRLRRRYRERIRAEIAETVASPGEIEEEIRSLFAALAD